MYKVEWVYNWLGQKNPGSCESTGDGAKKGSSGKKRFSHVRFEPAGFTKNPEIPMAKSLVDYIFRWLEKQFTQTKAPAQSEETVTTPNDQFASFQSDAPICDQCGSLCVRSGSCFLCHNCGRSLGCS